MSWYTEYKKTLKMVEVEEYFDLFFYRPLAFLLVKIIYYTRLTPNQVTYAAIVTGITSGFLYSLGTPYYFSLGALFFALYNVIDCSDGMLARLKKTGTHAGRIVDGIADYISTGAVFLGIGIGFANKQINPGYWWLLLVATATSNVIQSALVDYYRNRFLDYVLQRKSTFDEDMQSFRQEYEQIRYQKGKWADRIILDLYFKYSAMQRKLTGNKKKIKKFEATPQEYYAENKLAVRMWVMIGPTAQITMQMLFSILNRFDIFFWLMIIGFNAWATIMWIVQRRIDNTFKTAVQ